jgi:hypothetical protein
MVKVTINQPIYNVKLVAPNRYKVSLGVIIRQGTSGSGGSGGDISMHQLEYVGTGLENNKIIVPGISNAQWTMIFQSTLLRKYTASGAVPENYYRINPGDEVELGSTINAGDEITVSYQTGIGSSTIQMLEYTGTGTENNKIYAPGISSAPWILVFQSTILRRFYGGGTIPENHYRINAGDEVELGSTIQAGEEIHISYQTINT